MSSLKRNVVERVYKIGIFIVLIAKLNSFEIFNRRVIDPETGCSEDEHGEFETTCSRAENGFQWTLRRIKRTGVHFYIEY